MGCHVGALAPNLGILACSAVHTSRAALAVAGAGACLVGVVLLAHAVALTTRVGRPVAARLGHTVWFYLATSAALLAGMGRGLLLAIVAAGTADADREQGLAHVHLNLLGWRSSVPGMPQGRCGCPGGSAGASQRAGRGAPEIVELDCNPVKVLPDGVVVVDARVRVDVASPPPPFGRLPPLIGNGPMEPGHRRPGTGQVWTGTLVPWSSR